MLYGALRTEDHAVGDTKSAIKDQPIICITNGILNWHSMQICKSSMGITDNLVKFWGVLSLRDTAWANLGCWDTKSKIPHDRRLWLLYYICDICYTKCTSVPSHHVAVQCTDSCKRSKWSSVDNTYVLRMYSMPQPCNWYCCWLGVVTWAIHPIQNAKRDHFIPRKPLSILLTIHMYCNVLQLLTEQSQADSENGANVLCVVCVCVTQKLYSKNCRPKELYIYYELGRWAALFLAIFVYLNR